MSLDDDSDKKTATEIIALEWGRFEAADRDKNGTLSKEEFKAAIFPHEYSYMVDQMVNVSTPCIHIYTSQVYHTCKTFTQYSSVILSPGAYIAIGSI